jgi:glyoxylase-like metal-dependent hydrolase (beta-lactamase superfamily II)
MSTLVSTTMPSAGAAGPEVVVPGLLAFPPETLPFAPSLAIRAFLLQRPAGNLLVYSSGTVADAAPAVATLGGIARHYLNHWHEAGLGGEAIARTFAAPLFCHENERSSVAEVCPVAGTFARRQKIDDDFELIPIPGHTSGATAFLWDSGHGRCLFTGDSVYLSRGEWVAAVLEGSSDRAAYIDSLERIKEIEFDLLVPWAATAGQHFVAATDKADAGRRIDAMVERLRRGGDR